MVNGFAFVVHSKMPAISFLMIQKPVGNARPLFLPYQEPDKERLFSLSRVLRNSHPIFIFI